MIVSLGVSTLIKRKDQYKHAGQSACKTPHSDRLTFPDGDGLCPCNRGWPGGRWGTNWRGYGEGWAAPSVQSKLQLLVPLNGGIKAADRSVARRLSAPRTGASCLPSDTVGEEVAGGPDGTDGGAAERHLCTAAGKEHGGRHQQQSLALHYEQNRLARRQLRQL